MKDWTGGKGSVYATLGSSNHSNKTRAENDFYATSPDAIDMLLEKVQLPHTVIEPACGAGHLALRLEELGHDVHSYDLIDRGFGQVKDFFAVLGYPFDEYAIVTNPPYRFANQFVKHAIEISHEGGLICMFLKTTFAEGQARYNSIFRKYPPLKVLQFVGRVMCARNGDFEQQKKQSSAVAYAWWVWKKGHNGPTILDWIK